MRQEIFQNYFPDLHHIGEEVTAATAALPRANRGKVPVWQQLLNLVGLVKVRDAVTRETVALTPTGLALVRMNMEDPENPGLIEVRRYPFEQMSSASAGPGKHQSTIIKLDLGGTRDEVHFWPAVDESMRPEQATYEQIYPELQAMTSEITNSVATRG